MTVGGVPGFLPSVYGLHFANSFPPGPTVRLGPFDTRFLFGIGDASAGLCGGMALTARDLFEARQPSPPDATPPANGSPRFDALVRRQVESLDWFRVPLRYLNLQALRGDPPTGIAAALGREPARVVAYLREWPAIRAEIDLGHPSIVGLVRSNDNSPLALVDNHQVLGYAYEETPAEVVIHVYDPNHPGADDVELRVDIAPSPTLAWRDRIRVAQSTGEPLFGFLHQPYPASPLLRAWRTA
jgi:hypothetical protein